MNPEYQQQMAKLKEDDKKANTLCIISVLCTLVGYVLIPIFGGIKVPDYLTDSLPGDFTSFVENVRNATSAAVGLMAWALQIAGFVIMIVARVKYPKNTFAKVLMWIYIVNVVISVIAVVLLVGTCIYIASQCRGF